MKKIVLLLLLLAGPFSLAFSQESGTCGENLVWTLSDGTLTIKPAEGTSGGAMENYIYSSSVPWTDRTRDISKVIIEKGVTTIGRCAFSYCRGLTSVSIPESVTSIGDRAFIVTNLRSVEWNAVDCKIGSNVFNSSGYGANKLQNIVFGNQVIRIPGSLCDGITTLTSVTMGESVAFIDSSAFRGCTGLTAVTIPESVTSMKEDAFYGCKNLTSVEWNARHCADFSKSPFSYAVFIIFGNEVEYIPARLCSDCSSLKSVTIPDNVTAIGDFVFYRCTSISGPLCNSKVFAYMPTDYRGEYAIPSGIQSIAGGAFYGCSGLTSITIPDSVTSIGKQAFYNCSGLTSVTSLAVRPPSCGENTFDFYVYLRPLYVPQGSRSAYRLAQEWSKFTVVEDGTHTRMVMVKVNDSSMGRVVGGGDYVIDEEATLEAIPNDGYHFVQWEYKGAYISERNPFIMTVTGDVELTAIFAKDEENPDNPDDPDNPDNPTANEAPEADNFRVYAQDHTIYLSEDKGLVQVYNMAGQCIYNGHSISIPVWQSGVYVVVVGAQRFKVVVR